MAEAEHDTAGHDIADTAEYDIADTSEYDMVIVGAGFAGLYMLHRAHKLGLRVLVFEAGGDVGGTWYWNRYPGARCDVESMEYSYQFDDDLQQEWQWSERYSAQPEILRYVNHVADRFGLRGYIQFDTRVSAATFDEATNRWVISTDHQSVRAQWMVMATGCLSSANTPAFPGIESFAGPMYHTGKWPHEGVDFTGKRVGVIGTGSSGIQAIPIIAAQCTDLIVFQRTANYSIPAHNGQLDRDYEQQVKASYTEFRAANSLMPGAFGSKMPRGDKPALAVDDETRKHDFEYRWNEVGGFAFLGGFVDLLIDPNANETAAQFARDRIHDLVHDQAVADLLSPKQVIGCKRLCLDTGYFETFNRDNVHLVDISSAPIERLTTRAVVTGGTEYEVDCLVFATGFDAMTGTLMSIDIRGRDGLGISDAWSAGPRTYLGLQVAGFPNMFTISGPGSPSVLTNMIVSIEQHVNFIADCIAHLREHGHARIEATEQAQDAWVEHVNMIADLTLYPTCNSWYLGANVPGKTRVFMPLLGFPPYVDKCNEVVANGYEGFALSA
ncbi:MAG: NAD(P)/FAD-dependent oxidoreductase [Ilumatobacteraceae bacterium]